MPQQGFNIATFSSVISEKGLQKTNKFLVKIPIPLGLIGTDSVDVVRNLEFWCDGIQLPGFMINTFPVLRYGYGTIEKIPNQPVFNDISLSVLSDGQGDNWYFFTEWLNFILRYQTEENTTTIFNETNSRGIIQTVTGRNPHIAEVRYKYEYAVDMRILMFEENGDVIQSICLRDAYPYMIALS